MNNIEQALQIANKWFTENCEYTESEVAEYIKAALAELEKCEPVEVKLRVLSLKGFEVDRGTFKTMDEATAYGKREHGDRDDVTCEYLELYTSPISKEWVGLSNAEIHNIYNNLDVFTDYTDFARAIEAKLKQLNTKG